MSQLRIRRRPSAEQLSLQLLGAVCNDKSLAVIANILNHGADVNSKDDVGITALSWAAYAGRIQLCKLLLDKGAQLDGVSEQRHSPLAFAAGSGKVKTCRYLIEKGSDLSLKDIYENTYLHLASLNGWLHVCVLLLEFGVDSSVKNKFEESALDVAKAKGFVKIVVLLEKYVSTPATVVDKVPDPNKRRRDDSGSNGPVVELECPENQLRLALERCAKAEAHAAMLSSQMDKKDKIHNEAIARERLAKRKAQLLAAGATSRLTTIKLRVNILESNIKTAESEVAAAEERAEVAESRAVAAVRSLLRS